MLGSSYTYKSWRCVRCRKPGREINQGDVGIVAQRQRLQGWLDPYVTKIDLRQAGECKAVLVPGIGYGQWWGEEENA